jgi:hypothetical protein
MLKSCGISDINPKPITYQFCSIFTRLDIDTGHPEKSCCNDCTWNNGLFRHDKIFTWHMLFPLDWENWRQSRKSSTGRNRRIYLDRVIWISYCVSTGIVLTDVPIKVCNKSLSESITRFLSALSSLNSTSFVRSSKGNPHRFVSRSLRYSEDIARPKFVWYHCGRWIVVWFIYRLWTDLAPSRRKSSG